MPIDDALSPYERAQQQRLATDERAKKVKEYALKQGFGIVQLSARRYAVIKLSSWGCFSARPHDSVEEFFPDLTFYMEYGPASWQECRSWVANNVSPLPPELRPG
jgi:hypothetical protein